MRLSSWVSWSKRLGGVARLGADLAFPVRCEGCDGPAGEEGPLCEACEGAMLRSGSEPACGACGRLLAQFGDGCQSCRGKGIPHIERVARLAVYEGAVRRLVLAMKFERRWSVGTYLGRLLAARADVAELVGAADAVVPVPLHHWRHFGRGFNQAEVIARAMAPGKCARLLSRQRATAVQSRQSSATARAKNVKGAFAIAWRARVPGKRVLLVDDLLTTGATIEEAARTLKRAGAARVDVAVIAIPDHRAGRPIQLEDG